MFYFLVFFSWSGVGKPRPRILFLLKQSHDLPFSLSYASHLFLLIFFPSLFYSQSAYTCSQGNFYDSLERTGTASGACRYDEYFDRNLNGRCHCQAARAARACYQVWCTNSQLCEGVKIVVTDHGEGDYTDFIMSAQGFVKLARPNMAADLMGMRRAYGDPALEA